MRITEADIDQQVLAVFDRMRVEDEKVRDWFRLVLASQTRDAQAESLAQRAELQRQETLLVQQQDRLLNMWLAEDIDQDTFAKKHTELRDRLASIKLQLDAVDRNHDETAELAAKVFELSQTLRQQWLTADYAAKRRILEIVFLNCRLDGATLVPEMRKPFDVLAEGFLQKDSRGKPRCTFVNEIIGLPMALSVFPEIIEFSGDAVLTLVETGLYRKGLRVQRGTDS